MLYKYKDLSIGFIIFSPEHNIGRIKSTLRSITNHYPSSPVICVTTNTSIDVFQQLNDVLPTFKASDSIASMVNTGLHKGHKEWNIFITEGTYVKSKIDFKYSFFMESNKDVFFPLTAARDRDGKITKSFDSFEDATMNGMMIHRDTFLEVGDFPNLEPAASRFVWGAMAQEKGVKFKAILGSKIC